MQNGKENEFAQTNYKQFNFYFSMQLNFVIKVNLYIQIFSRSGNTLNLQKQSQKFDKTEDKTLNP